MAAKNRTRKHKLSSGMLRSRRMRGCGLTGSKPSRILYSNTGDVRPLKASYAGKPIFRKENPSDTEQQIARIIMHNPHPNIVTIYAVSPDKIDMELVTPFIETKLNPDSSHKEQLKKAKEHLQKYGIVYIDWKLDNVGIGKDGLIKLYDFDMSYIFDGDVFIAGPTHHGYKYKNAKASGYINPKNMNNAIFLKEFKTNNEN